MPALTGNKRSAPHNPAVRPNKVLINNDRTAVKITTNMNTTRVAQWLEQWYILTAGMTSDEIRAYRDKLDL